MRLVEYRILVPLTVDEFFIGQSWSFSEVSRLNTSGGVGIEIIKNEAFDVPADRSADLSSFLPEYENEKPKKTSKKANLLKNFVSGSQHSTDNESHSNSKNQQSTMHTSKSVPSDMKTLTTETKTGQYTYKQYKIASLLPWYIQKLFSPSSLIFHEKSWNMYPTCKTHISNDFMKDKFRVYLNSIIREFKNTQYEENVHGLTPEQLAKREIINIDISQNVPASDYIESEDPRKFKSSMTGRGPLVDNWWCDQTMPVLCIYRLVECEFVWFGLQSKVESTMISSYKKIFNRFHRQIFTWIDKWYNMSKDDLRKIEIELQKTLTQQINQGEVVAKRLDDDETETA
jgi:hypothetical protein